MSAITLYDKNDVTVSLNQFFFDPEIEGVQAELAVQNRKGVHINVVICDLWDGERFYDDFTIISSISPQKTTHKILIELSATDEEERIIQFQKGYLPNFSFRISVYSRCNDSDTLGFCGKGAKITISKFSITGVAVERVEYFDISYAGDTLFAASKHHIPFEINKSNREAAKQIKSFKDELSNRIETMEICSDTVLVAQYGELGKPRFYDIENMCIYNLGTSTFSQCCQNDIAFMELTESEIASQKSNLHTTCDCKCFYAYTPLWRKELDELLQSKSVLANWDSIDIATDIPDTPLRYWKSIRKQFDQISVYNKLTDPANDNFGLKITLHLPQKVLPARVMKPLLDGIVCAFHKNSTDYILRQITSEHFEQLVTDAEKAISLLGKQDYLHSYKKSVKWNPADERLKFAWVSVVSEDYKPYFDGTLFAW